MLRPRIKRAHRPILRPSGVIWIGGVHYGLGSEIEDETGLAWRMCQLMDGSRTREELLTDITTGTEFESDDAAAVIDVMIESGWVEDAGAPVPQNLTSRELDRYSRSMQLLSWVDQTPRQSPFELQSRLKNARVTVIGVGGIGSAVAVSLAASGVGRIHCVDGDLVELSNLNRQLLFTGADIGRPKVEAAVARLRELNDDIEITGTNMMINTPDELEQEVLGSDLFVHCADRPDGIEYWSNQIGLRLSIPWVIASYTGPMLAVAAFIPGETACFDCLINHERRRMAGVGNGDIYDYKRTPGFNPVMAPVAQMSGHFAAMEIIYYLLGMRVQTAGRQLHRNIIDYEHQYYLDAVAQPDCPACGSVPSRPPVVTEHLR